jgi:hypothetical protein
MLVVYVLVLGILSGPYGQSTPPRLNPEFAVALLIIGLVATVLLTYTRLRFASDQSLLASVLAARGTPIGDPEGAVRLADPEERAARRRLRRGDITRTDYERIIARRHFAHGEISHAEYEEIIRQLVERNPDARRGARPPPDQA